ncbi:hypothetical protein G6F35_017670 [Rhizopus arrhizus]|nr:hypothetical protein G6F35_017670 [Rhizopus arrhizus]
MRWLMSLAHMEPSPVSRWVALRAALAIGLPSAAGLALDQSAAAALVALGALPAITGDNGGPYRNRALSIGATVFGGALGYLLGNLVAGHGLWTSAAMTVLVLIASLVGTFNNIAAPAALAAVGAGGRGRAVRPGSYLVGREIGRAAGRE